MNTPKDGGPAFPVLESEAWGEPTRGMSLRDWFAGQAIQGLMANNDFLLRVDQELPNMSTREAIACYAYGVADCALAAREEKQ